MLAPERFPRPSRPPRGGGEEEELLESRTGYYK